MKKIPSLFLQTHDHVLTREVNPACEWVMHGMGKPTAKLDGSACMVKDGMLYKRYDNRKKLTPVETWVHCGDTSERGRHLYWVPVKIKDYYHQMAWGWAQGLLNDGTYELVGPEVQGNPHQFAHNALIRHGAVSLDGKNPRTYDEIEQVLKQTVWEGIVWHHPDGRMAKITKKKFGIT